MLLTRIFTVRGSNLSQVYRGFSESLQVPEISHGDRLPNIHDHVAT
jgi:hypothetical protein